jgi:cytochrome c-type biogenesis protein CcmH
MKKWLPWALLAVVLVGALGVVLWPDGSRSDTARANALAGEIRCPECQGLSAANSSSTTARAIRVDIRERIEAGQSDAEIRQTYVDRYGESIVLRPEGTGLGLIVWGLPVLALILGGGGLFLALRRWRAEPHVHATEADEALVERERGPRESAE